MERFGNVWNGIRKSLCLRGFCGMVWKKKRYSFVFSANEAGKGEQTGK